MTATHRPGSGRVTPTSTYRLQIHADFGFAQAAAIVPYLADLGVSHLYLSPVLDPVPGSRHGYDVLDHTRIHTEAGGQAAFDELVAVCHEHGLGIVVDVVPNHMAVPTPAHLNAPLWSVLRDGRDSPYAAWFDVDWAAEDDRILMPVLGTSVPAAIAAGELVLAQDGGASGRAWVLRYHGNEFPVRPGTQTLPLPELVEAQAYRLASWREAADALNYRRFFDVTSLVAVRVEDPVVFAATHATLLGLLGRGDIDGFRIDHPDGLADPTAYLDRLADASGDAWVVVEKILEGAERLPEAWRCSGTTGYDALLRVQQLLTWESDPGVLDREWAAVAPDRADLELVVRTAKELVVADAQAAEIDRLIRLARVILPGEDPGALRRGLEALLIGMGRYRAYLRAGEVADPAEYAVLDAAEAAAVELVAEEDREAVAVMAQLCRGGGLPQSVVSAREVAEEFRVRFQQTCGPVMAKGIEDTAFYRWLRLAGANEVGGDPAHVSITAPEFHSWCADALASWPTTMTTLTTHDTKRSEDVRARLMVLAEDPSGWVAWVGEARVLAERHRTERVDPPTEYLLWQTIVGTWPISADRLVEYTLKAVREAKVHTAWVDGDAAYEAEVSAFAAALATDPVIAQHVERWLAGHEIAYRAAVLGTKAVQLTMPGVPDTYQGAEIEVLTLVDPDNRRPVVFEERRERLARLQSGVSPLSLGDAKLALVRGVLQLRRARPEAFVGPQATYLGLDTGSPHLVAFARGDQTGPVAVTVATRGAGALAAAGGWRGLTLALPAGQWRDVASDRVVNIAAGESVPVRELLGFAPAVVLERLA